MFLSCNRSEETALAVHPVGHLHNLCRNLLRMHADVFTVTSAIPATCQVNAMVFVVLLQVC